MENAENPIKSRQLIITNMNMTEYMAELLKKCGKKKWESYVISRLWCELNDERVIFIYQQAIFLQDGKRYLADLYLPQLNLVVEIDEWHHLSKEEEDNLREKRIYDTTGATIKHIKCHEKADQTINAQISSLAVYIKEKIAILENLNQFSIRDFEKELSADYYLHKEYLSVLENDAVRNTTEAFRLFHLKPKQCSCQNIPYIANLAVWCPYEQGKDWNNQLENEGTELIEEYIGEDSSSKHSTPPENHQEKRIIFLKKKDAFGHFVARFVGVFKFDRIENGKSHWLRVSYYCDLKNLFLYSQI